MTFTPSERKLLTELDPDRTDLERRNRLAWSELLVDYYRTRSLTASMDATARRLAARNLRVSRAEAAAAAIDQPAKFLDGKRGLPRSGRRR
jgi:hypothetical protein